MNNNITFGLSFFIIASVMLLGFSDIAYAEQLVTDRVKIDSNTLPTDISFRDFFGWEIESIGDLDGDGIDDLAVVKRELNSSPTNYGSVLIMFMNENGSVKATNEIEMNTTASGIGASCIAANGSNTRPMSLNGLAFVGDLDGDGLPTLALGSSSSIHNGIGFSGAVYMLELDSDGTVDNCFRITPNNPSHTSGFDPADNVYRELGGAQLGYILFATDLNGDGQNEILAGARDVSGMNSAGPINFWPLFLNSTGGVSSHPAVPIFGGADIGITRTINGISGDTISGGTKIVIGDSYKTPGGSIFIVTLDSTGAFVSSTEISAISLDQGLTGSSYYTRADYFGKGVASIGDMDGDGVDDILVGNRLGDDIIGDSGEVYILYMNYDDTVKESQKISNDTEFTRNGSIPFREQNWFGSGITLWTDIGTNAVFAIGAVNDRTGGYNSGAVYLFSVERASPEPEPTPELEPVVPTKPSSPNDLSAIAGDSQVILNWTEPNDGGSPIISYYVWWFDGNNNKDSTYYDNSNGSTLTITGLNVEEYRFNVASINSVGWSNSSNEVFVTPTGSSTNPPMSATLSQAPNDLTAISGNEQVTLSWTTPDDGGSPITEYYVYYFDTAGNKQSTYHNSSLGTTLIITGLTNGEEYRFNIISINSVGRSNSSNEVLVTPN